MVRVLWPTGLVLLLGVFAAAGQTATSTPTQNPATGNGAEAKTNALGPRITFATTEHDFGRAESGEQVKYTYVFTNTGDATLEITGVHACGCITPDFTRKTEPGQTGTVPISFNSSAYGGPVTKAITVTCNDKTSPTKVLMFRGTVWKTIDVNPSIVMFDGLNVESPAATRTVTIKNNMEEPLTISEPESQNQAFKAELKTITPGKEFQLVLSTVPPLKEGNTTARFALKTSSAKMKEIDVTAFANNVQPVVMVTPPQIHLPGGPLAAEQSYSVSFVSRAPQPVSLSEASVNAEGVQVQLEEKQPGKMYEARLVFPKGFAVMPGQHVELSVKSSLASSPLIRVPLIQSALPTATITPVKPAVSRTVSSRGSQASSP